MEKAIQMDVMLHAYMFMQSGIPVIYSGDEIGQVNDYSYKNDPDKAPDSRYIHRGAMNWDRAAMSGNARTVEGKLNKRLLQLEKIRKTEKAFMTNADTWTVDTWDNSILCTLTQTENQADHESGRPALYDNAIDTDYTHSIGIQKGQI